MHDALEALSDDKAAAHGSGEDEPPPPWPELMVDHEIAELVCRDGLYTTRVRRQLRNTGRQPVTRYQIRVAVDRYPGDPERSNELYRHDPLTWDEIARGHSRASADMGQISSARAFLRTRHVGRPGPRTYARWHEYRARHHRTAPR
jgi:hypothetical protein